MGKILVTGGTGFTGKALVKRLLSQGHQVVAMDYKPGVAKKMSFVEFSASVFMLVIAILYLFTDLLK